MDAIFEFLLEIYMDLMVNILPEGKSISGKCRALATILAIISMFGNLGLFIYGGILLFERHNFFGIALIAIAVLWALVQIFLGFTLGQKNDK